MRRFKWTGLTLLTLGCSGPDNTLADRGTGLEDPKSQTGGVTATLPGDGGSTTQPVVDVGGGGANSAGGISAGGAGAMSAFDGGLGEGGTPTSACTSENAGNLVVGTGYGKTEICGDGLDNDGNGFIDENCACKFASTQPCYGGFPSQAGVGACSLGVQTCEGSPEFPGWGRCKGWKGPEPEVCEGSKDENCNGLVDDGCACCTGDTQPCGIDVGACKPGVRTCVAGVWGVCEGATEPVEEICDDGIDNNCNGLVDEGCDINLEIVINGDCAWASCPPQAPYVVGCKLDFQGATPRGCVSYAPGSSLIFLKEGDYCDQGKVVGTLSCSNRLGIALNATSCPINKTETFYVTDPAQCPCKATPCY
jgi:hypothetical protein